MSNIYMSGAQFTLQTPSTFLPGEFLYGNDGTAQLVATTGTGTPLSGTVGAWSMTVTTSRVLHATTSTGVTYLIGAEDQGLTGEVTPSDWRLIDVNGNAAAQRPQVSGAAGVLINGSVAPVVLSTNYGVKTFTQVTGNNWIAF